MKSIAHAVFVGSAIFILLLAEMWHTACSFANGAMVKEKYAVLLAEDCESDRRLLQIAFRRVSRIALIGMVTDGVEAIAYLAGTGDYANRHRFPFPDLLLLDMCLPLKSGLDVLAWLQHQSFPELKVAVLSGSIDPLERQKAINLGARLYQVKTVDLRGLVDFVKSLEEYMTRTA